MTIDEAIEMYKKIANTDSNCPRYCMNTCEDCVNECKQIAEWLEELKEYKKNSNTCPMCDTYCSYIAEEFENGYNKAIDDFVTNVKEHQYLLSDVINSKDYGMVTVGIEQIAEQLKAGGMNEYNI